MDVFTRFLHRRPARRELKFHSLADVLCDVAALSRGARTVGNWSLGQICMHLADTVNGSIDGLNLRNHRWKRRLAGKPLLYVTFRFGIPRGFTVDPALTPPATELDAAVSALEMAIARYHTHVGPLRAHPLFGRLTRRQWDRMHCVHCAHHLSFAWPQAAAPPAPDG